MPFGKVFFDTHHTATPSRIGLRDILMRKSDNTPNDALTWFGGNFTGVNITPGWSTRSVARFIGSVVQAYASNSMSRVKNISSTVICGFYHNASASVVRVFVHDTAASAARTEFALTAGTHFPSGWTFVDITGTSATTLYALLAQASASGMKVIKSTNGGSTWSEVAAMPLVGTTINMQALLMDIHIGSSSNIHVMYHDGQGGTPVLHSRSTNDGGSWTNTTVVATNNGISASGISPSDNRLVVVSRNTSNVATAFYFNGTTWSTGGSLTDFAAKSLIYTTGNTWYATGYAAGAATGSRIFKSTDNGTTWNSVFAPSDSRNVSGIVHVGGTTFAFSRGDFLGGSSVSDILTTTNDFATIATVDEIGLQTYGTATENRPISSFAYTTNYSYIGIITGSKTFGGLVATTNGSLGVSADRRRRFGFFYVDVTNESPYTISPLIVSMDGKSILSSAFRIDTFSGMPVGSFYVFFPFCDVNGKPTSVTIGGTPKCGVAFKVDNAASTLSGVSAVLVNDFAYGSISDAVTISTSDASATGAISVANGQYIVIQAYRSDSRIRLYVHPALSDGSIDRSTVLSSTSIDISGNANLLTGFFAAGRRMLFGMLGLGGAGTTYTGSTGFIDNLEFGYL